MRIVWVLAKVLASVVALLAVAVALGMYSNARALGAADEYCRGVLPGTPVGALLDSLEASGQRHRRRTDPEQVQVVFQGWVFNAAVCTLDTRGGRVVTGAVALDGD